MVDTINTYEAYLKDKKGNILTTEDAARIYREMVQSIRACTLDDKMDFWNDCIKSAMEYSHVRNEWEFMSREEKIAADGGRTVRHTGFIITVDVLARIAEAEGVDNSWRKELGDDRKRIGDFACYIAYITGISNR